MKEDLSKSNILTNNCPPISFEEALDGNHLIVDVRSVAEFESGTVPGAVNVPLFDEDERSVIGTIYKYGGQAKAIDQGFSYVDEKLADLLGAFEPFRGKVLAVFCARGGMRSKSIVNLLLQSGYSVCQLTGGYKCYRHDVLAFLDNYAPKIIVLHGLTGTGKTRIIQALDFSIDLEELAKHRSSLFGGLDREPSCQRTFETLLVTTAKSLGQEPYFVEGESRKIGRVFIPKPFAMAMKSGVLVNITCSLEKRIERIVEDYPVEGAKKRGAILKILQSLKQGMGGETVERMCDLFNSNQLHDLVRILLVDYYDKRYARSMSRYSFDLEISSESIGDAAEKLTTLRKTLL
ncbi:MAG: tRNA 2-selenouridine(34) synthase MnmH [Desulfotalea sp.]|nr:MAG: tRNA 2-selenouridine(34) synthase MnmH [Desulfotalea sp.]